MLPDYVAIERLYEQHAAKPTAMAPHLPRIRGFAQGCAEAVELGVKRGASTTALLLGARHVTSVDLVPTKEARELQQLAGDAWTYLEADTRTVCIPTCDLLLVDASHDYQSVKTELAQHADKVAQWLLFHDSLTFGSIGAQGETGRQRWQYRPGHSVPPAALGIRPAVDELMARDPSWHIAVHFLDSHGLLVLERRS